MAAHQAVCDNRVIAIRRPREEVALTESMAKLLRGAKGAGTGLLAAPVFLLVLLLVFLPLGILSGVCLVWGELYVWLRMRFHGRFLSGRKRRDCFARGRGTVIIESPAVGWNVTRAWWTDEDVLALAPAPPPTNDNLRDGTIWGHPFVRWAHERYTDIQTGRAMLLAVWNGSRMQRRWSKRYPKLRFVKVWSGFATFAAAQRERTTDAPDVSSPDRQAGPQ